MNREWPLWEVFVRARNGLAHKHAGSVHAADARMAIEAARDTYTRRMEGVSLWVVPSAAIIASDAAAAAQVASALGRGIGALVNAHDPETVSVSGLAASLLAAAPDAVHQAYLAALMRFRRASPPALLPSSLGDLGTLTGAAELVFDGFLTARGLTAWAAAKTP